MGPKTPSYPFVPLDVDIGNTAPDPQHREVRFLAIEGLPGGLARNSRGGSPVPDVDEGGKGFTPERQRQASLMKDGDDALFHSPVGTLSNTILLGSSPDRVLPLDAMFCTEVIHVSTHVLTTLVLPENLDLGTSLVLSPGLVLFEERECL